MDSPLRVLRVLIVDDDPSVGRVLGELLADDGMEVVGLAADGCAGVEQACRLTPDVVVMDARMPILDGLEATRLLGVWLPGVPVVMCTALDDRLVAAAARRAGAVAVVPKGGHPARLVEAIRQAASRGRVAEPVGAGAAGGRQEV